MDLPGDHWPWYNVRTFWRCRKAAWMPRFLVFVDASSQSSAPIASSHVSRERAQPAGGSWCGSDCATSGAVLIHLGRSASSAPLLMAHRCIADARSGACVRSRHRVARLVQVLRRCSGARSAGAWVCSLRLWRPGRAHARDFVSLSNRARALVSAEGLLRSARGPVCLRGRTCYCRAFRHDPCALPIRREPRAWCSRYRL